MVSKSGCGCEANHDGVARLLRDYARYLTLDHNIKADPLLQLADRIEQLGKVLTDAK